MLEVWYVATLVEVINALLPSIVSFVGLCLLYSARGPLLFACVSMIPGPVHRGAGVLHRVLSDQRGGRALPPPQDVGVGKHLCRRASKGKRNVW